MPSIVICDPSNKLPFSVCEALTRHRIPYGIVHAGCDCAALVRAARPDVVLISTETDHGFLGRVLTRVEHACPAERPAAILLMGDESPAVLSHRWGLPTEHCFQNPVSVADLLKLLEDFCPQGNRSLSTGESSFPSGLRNRSYLVVDPPHTAFPLGSSAEAKRESSNASDSTSH